MPPEEGGAIEPPAPEAAPSPPTDSQVAQNWFDEWSGKVEQDIQHLKQAISEIAQVKTGTPQNGPTSPEPRPAPSPPAQGGRSTPPPVSPAGQPVGQAPESQPGIQAEQAPKPGHWYFKRIWGGN